MGHGTPCVTHIHSPSFQAGCLVVDAGNLHRNRIPGFFVCLNENWKTCLPALNLNNKGIYCCSLSWLLSYFIVIRLCFGVYLQELNVLLVWAVWGFCNQFLQFRFRDLHSRPTIQWFLWDLCKPSKQNSSVLTLDPCKNGTHGKQYMRLGY